ncbi:MAG: chorismate synthase [Acholeplasmataceae bacterium]|nr:chorismate synthase [Acholeplasmataceae bacterium]
MNTYGQFFKVTLFGESHQPEIGVVVEGVPAGTVIDMTMIEQDLKKRRPGAVGTTARVEADHFRVTSGIFQGRATGSPLHLVIENTDTRSKDYQHLLKQPRPGHADYVASIKYGGFHDHRGGGRFSGRLTAALVMAGSLAKMFLPYTFETELIKVGTLTDMSSLDQYLEGIKAKGESVGGIVKLSVKGIPVGIGEPFFQKLDAEIAKMMFSIPAVKGVSFGLGFEGVERLGSDFNDVFSDFDGTTLSNHSGGVSGGLSNGNDLVLKVFVKPTSSIQKTQETYDFETKTLKPLSIGGRHDVAIVRRAGIVLENALAIVLADLTLMARATKVEKPTSVPQNL